MMSGLQIPLKPGLQVSHFENEYLVLHNIPREVVVKTVPVFSTVELTDKVEKVVDLGPDDMESTRKYSAPRHYLYLNQPADPEDVPDYEADECMALLPPDHPM